jgi:hypothetical protein
MVSSVREHIAEHDVHARGSAAASLAAACGGSKDEKNQLTESVLCIG